MRVFSLVTCCLLGAQFLTSLSAAVEGLQQTTARVIPIDINRASARAIAAALTGIEPANAKGFVTYRAISGIGAATLEKGIGRIPTTDY